MAAASGATSREATRRPHLVLIDTMAVLASDMPPASAEASFDRRYLYQKLPPLFMPWFRLSWMPAVGNDSRLQGKDQEVHTLCKSMDKMLKGETLPALMVMLGRLKALAATPHR